MLCAQLSHLLNNIHAVPNPAKRHVFEVQVFCFFQRYKELGIVGVASSICHRQDPWTCVANVKVLVLKRAPVDGLAPCAVAVGDITTLKQKVESVGEAEILL